jgi:ornithine--oxo-acid transaminase
MRSEEIIEQTQRYSAHNYHPLPVVIERAEGVYVYDTEGKRYTDMLSAYSAVNQGHRHPRIIAALKEQADRVTLTSRAFYNDKMGEFCEKLATLTGKDRVLPMNTGAEAVETAVKAVRRWGYDRKGISPGQAEIIVCAGNFHGRTLAAISMSSSEEYKRGFEPLVPGFTVIPFGDAQALEAAITPNTAAFLVEPIQGEAGVIIPPDGFLTQAANICRAHDVLFVADEIQSGFGRAGKMFACDWENVVPDVYILGKALGGGVVPISAVAANDDVLGVFEPGSHGSTFGGNSLACACAIAALDVLIEENLAQRSRELGDYFAERLHAIRDDRIVAIRARGLWIGLELNTSARPFCEALQERGLLCKETHDNVIRFAPPLVIRKDELDASLTVIQDVFSAPVVS